MNCIRNFTSNSSIYKSQEPQNSHMSELVLPEDVIFAILVRLPAPSLLRFRCVCKSWHSLIATNDFCISHLTHALQHNHNLKLIFSTEPPVYTTPQPSSYPNCMTIPRAQANLPLDVLVCNICRDVRTVVGYCNGLVCFMRHSRRMALFNPATRKFKQLPPTDEFVDKEINYGFGYDDVSMDYRVVRIVSHKEEGLPSQVEVYSLHGDAWENLEDTPYVPRSSLPGKFVSGAIHWVATHCANRRTKENLVIAFDVAEKRFEEVPQPDYDETAVRSINVTECNGRLYFLSWDDKFMKAWSMRDYGVKDSWVAEFAVDTWRLLSELNDSADGLSSSNPVCIPLYVTGNLVVFHNWPHLMERIVTYYLDSKMFVPVTKRINWASVFVESLVPLDQDYDELTTGEELGESFVERFSINLNP